MATRIARLAAALVMTVLTVGSTLALTTTTAGADTASAESQFVTLINQLRQSKGLRPLAVDPRLTTVARNWSAHMASNKTLAHNPNLAQQAPSDWTKLGENVGYGPDVQTVHNAFVKSAAHYANLVDSGYNAMGIGVVVSGSTMWVTEAFEFSPSAPPPTAQTAPSNPTQGYWLVARDGGIFSYGTAAFKGATGHLRLNQPIVGMTKCVCGGYWFVAADGGIFAFGAPFFGSTGHLRLNSPIVGMAATPTDVKAPSRTRKGYWLVARDGGIFSFGDAGFHGSTGHIRLNQPIVSMAANPAGSGYWFVAADGGIFAFGDAKFYGSAGGQPTGSPVVGMAASPNGAGYRLVTANGLVLTYGSAEWNGGITVPLNQPIVGMAAA